MLLEKANVTGAIYSSVEASTIRQNSVWTMHGRVIRPAQT